MGCSYSIYAGAGVPRNEECAAKQRAAFSSDLSNSTTRRQRSFSGESTRSTSVTMSARTTSSTRSTSSRSSLSSSSSTRRGGSLVVLRSGGCPSSDDGDEFVGIPGKVVGFVSVAERYSESDFGED